MHAKPISNVNMPIIWMNNAMMIRIVVGFCTWIDKLNIDKILSDVSKRYDELTDVGI
jgi:hypothetical protein